MNSRVARIVATQLLVVAVILAMAAPAFAYPSGYTSDNAVVTSGASGQVDISSHGDDVHLAYLTSDGVIYKRSTDRGSGWSAPVLLGTGTNPQVTVTSANVVFVAYSNDSDVLVRRSQDSGVTWQAGNYASLTASNPIQALAITHNGDNPALAFQHINAASGKSDVYWSPITSGMMTETKASHIRLSDENTVPRICWDGARYVIVWQTRDYIDQLDDGLWYRFSNLPTDAVLVEDSHITPGLYHTSPDVAWHGVDGQFDVSYVHHPGGGSNSVVLNSFNGSSWSGGLVLYDAGSQQPVPRVTPCSGGTIVCRSSAGQDVEMLTGTATVLMKGVNPAAASTCRDSAAGDSYYAVASGGRVLVKRSDTMAPSAATQAPSYVNSSFSLSYVNVVDDWNATGTDPYGDGYTSGVTSIQPQHSTSAIGPWVNLGSVIDNAPWTTTVNISGLSDGTKFIRGFLTDTAGRTAPTSPVQVVIDRIPPTATLSTGSTPNADGWRRSTTITITGSDANYDRCEYRIDGGPWTRYTSPFTAAQGQHSYGYRAMDKAGNSSGSASQTLWVDSDLPACQWDYPCGDTMTADRDNGVSLHASATDLTSGVGWIGLYLDGNLVAEADGPEQGYYWRANDKMNGTVHTLTVKTRDYAGNESTATKTARLVTASTAYGDLYFAEGTTRPGFDEYLCVLNPDTTNTANLTIDYQLGTGQVIAKTATVNPASRLTIRVNDHVPAGNDVSARVHSTGAYVVAERPMYFNYNGWTGGHTAVGINALQKDYYFAEGTTRDGFSEYLTLQNPGSAHANATITYMLGTGKTAEKDYSIAPHSRLTANVNADVGPDQDVSVHVHSDQPIAAERPMYFNYHGKWDGGHDVVGVTTPQRTWFFAEGTTRDGFDEWLCIQNPGGSMANVSVSYSTGTTKRYAVPAHSRSTVNVNADVGANRDVSAVVTADQPVIAERPMYFDYNGLTGGSDTLGASSPGKDFYFAEGTTRSGFNEFLTILTTAGSGNVVEVIYQFPDGQQVTKEHKLRANRETVSVNDDVGPGKDVSVRIYADQQLGNAFVVERPMYFDYRGWTGGSDVPGYSFD